ncbi:MAG: flagellar biosynthetic protein FliQ [Opitutus sp.]|nr:flagellar biosynthetic protein FliQ [Opitutus sp.]MCS6248008.1 flagellar biosynthetic protein FliQ [Opitutus sp.]MCS6273384.1 flagellar biosynthetic protein FliQ [Opitutus sp.]MCS6277450.1 flagellar biosynthetic protein FliQ [Opitutus sp.]MCS6300567.1 flagellar biosynthetic protein FliQ [Opitutus sp.]
MNAEAAIDIFKTVVMFSLYLMAPFVGVILIVGLLTSLVQSVTSIQEATLTFVPKLIALAAVMMLLAPWVLRLLSEYTVQSLMRISSMGP